MTLLPINNDAKQMGRSFNFGFGVALLLSGCDAPITYERRDGSLDGPRGNDSNVVSDRGADSNSTDARIDTSRDTGTSTDTSTDAYYTGPHPYNPPQANFGAGANDTGDPVGGFTGFRETFTTGDVTVGTRAELNTALQNASSGDVIYVAADIDMTAQSPTNSAYVNLPDGVTLAGNRGVDGSLGPRLFWTSIVTNNDDRFGIAMGRGSKVFGLRIEGDLMNVGAFTLTQSNTADDNDSFGVAFGEDNGELANCEIYGWQRAGVLIDGGTNLNVHHNVIRDNMISTINIRAGADPGVNITANYLAWRYWGVASWANAGGFVASFNRIVRQRQAPFAVSSRSNDAGFSIGGGGSYTVRSNTFEVEDDVTADELDFISPLEVGDGPNITAQGNWYHAGDDSPYQGTVDSSQGNVIGPAMTSFD